MKTWRCNVCQEIVYSEQVPQECPLCHVGSEFFEEIEIEEQEIYLNTDKKFCIIGSGIAGLSAARTLRELDKGCRIDLFSKDELPPYQRILLTKQVTTIQADSLLLESLDWFTQERINLHLQEAVLAINTDEQTLTTHKETYPYDDVVLAMGSYSFLPPIPNHDLDCIFTLRTYEDAIAVKAQIKDDHHAVIVGGGILGIELACELASAHIHVSIVETLPHLMAKQLDKTAAELLRSYVKSLKISVYEGIGIKSFYGINRVDSVELDNGKVLKANFVVVCAGVRSNLDMIANTAINFDRSIPVDAMMKTNLPHVYACGDVCAFDGINYNLWNEAQAQGIIAAQNICQKQSMYKTITPALYFHHENFDLFSVGDITQADQKIELLDETKPSYERICYQDGVCSGAILINQQKRVPQVLKLYESKEHYPL